METFLYSLIVHKDGDNNYYPIVATPNQMGGMLGAICPIEDVPVGVYSLEDWDNCIFDDAIQSYEHSAFSQPSKSPFIGPLHKLKDL